MERYYYSHSTQLYQLPVMSIITVFIMLMEGMWWLLALCACQVKFISCFHDCN